MKSCALATLAAASTCIKGPAANLKFNSVQGALWSLDWWLAMSASLSGIIHISTNHNGRNSTRNNQELFWDVRGDAPPPV